MERDQEEEPAEENTKIEYGFNADETLNRVSSADL